MNNIRGQENRKEDKEESHFNTPMQSKDNVQNADPGLEESND